MKLLIRKNSLIFFVYSGPKGSEEPTTRSGGARRSQNQFTSAKRNGVNKLIFKRSRRKLKAINQIKYFILFLISLILSSCIAKFIPEIDEKQELLVVQGLINDQFQPDTIKISKSLPLGQKSAAIPVSRCSVIISDNMGNIYSLRESKAGTYITDPEIFKGEIGRLYTLHIITNNNNNFRHYESDPVEMKPVPKIDSMYYEKVVVEQPYKFFAGVDACQIYLDTHDPENNCRFYRWDFSETWILRLLFPVVNETCWVSENSHTINIKSTAAFNESRINRFPINYISNITDRLKRKYSIQVNQYSLNEEEYNYWEKIKNISVQVGGLYDIIPASVPSNIRCIEIPGEKVLGYFSVSAKSSKRIFIKDDFPGIIDRYNKCPTDTIGYFDPPGLGISVWILDDEPHQIPPYRILTDNKGCADCTVRGSNIKPDYWEDK